MESPSRQDLEAARRKRDEHAGKLRGAHERLEALLAERLAALEAGDEERLQRVRVDLRKAEDEAEDAKALFDLAAAKVAEIERACAPYWQTLRDAIAAGHSFSIETDEQAARMLEGARTISAVRSFLHGQADLLEGATAADLGELGLQRPDVEAAREGARRVLRFWFTRRVYEKRTRVTELLEELRKFARVLDAELTQHAEETAAVAADAGADTIPTMDLDELHAAVKAIVDTPGQIEVRMPTPAREPADSPTPRRRGLFSRGEEART